MKRVPTCDFALGTCVGPARGTHGEKIKLYFSHLIECAHAHAHIATVMPKKAVVFAPTTTASAAAASDKLKPKRVKTTAGGQLAAREQKRQSTKDRVPKSTQRRCNFPNVPLDELYDFIHALDRKELCNQAIRVLEERAALRKHERFSCACLMSDVRLAQTVAEAGLRLAQCFDRYSEDLEFEFTDPEIACFYYAYRALLGEVRRFYNLMNITAELKPGKSTFSLQDIRTRVEEQTKRIRKAIEVARTAGERVSHLGRRRSPRSSPARFPQSWSDQEELQAQDAELLAAIAKAKDAARSG